MYQRPRTVLKITLYKDAQNISSEIVLRELGFECGKKYGVWYKECRHEQDAQSLARVAHQKIKDRMLLAYFGSGPLIKLRIWQSKTPKWW